MPQISIIVPVYNVERYLRRCIDSIISQSCIDWECILVDDGSKDSSGDICDDYSRKDNRFVVIHKENGGVSSARNAGLDIAKGAWIAFVDSDDWLEDSYLNVLLSSIDSDTSIVQSSFFFCDGTNKNICYLRKETVELSDYFNRLLARDGVRLEVWGKLIRRELIGKVRFSPEIKMGEDWLFLIQCSFKGTGRIDVVQNCVYNYFYSNPTSAMHILQNNTDDVIKLIKKNLSLNIVQNQYLNTFLVKDKMHRILDAVSHNHMISNIDMDIEGIQPFFYSKLRLSYRIAAFLISHRFYYAAIIWCKFCLRNNINK